MLGGPACSQIVHAADLCLDPHLSTFSVIPSQADTTLMMCQANGFAMMQTTEAIGVYSAPATFTA